MHSFADTTGRQWTIAVNVASIKRVRDLAQVDLLKIVENKCELLARLYDDPILLVDVLYCVVKPDADAAGKDGIRLSQPLRVGHVRRKRL